MMTKNKNSTQKTPSRATKAPVRRRPFYQSPIFAFIVVLTLVAIASFTYFKFFRKSDNSGQKDSSSQLDGLETSKPADSSSKTEQISGSTGINQEGDGKTPEQYDGKNPNLSDSLTGNLTYAGFSGDNFLVRVAIDQYLTSGTCSLVISDGNKTLEKTADIFADATSSSCQGFDIPKSEIESLSNYLEITINLTSNDKTGQITGVATL